MMYDILFSVLAGILIVVGILGSFLPVLPGPPLSWAGLLVAYFSDYNLISGKTLIITAIFAILSAVFDNIFPIFMTKKTGGSKAASWGSTLGLVVGLFLGPVCVIVLPFLGALIGELINTGGEFGKSLKSAWGAFLGFLMGTGFKMIVCLCFLWIFIASFF